MVVDDGKSPGQFCCKKSLGSKMAGCNAHGDVLLLLGPRWWQLKYFLEFSPRNLGKVIQFDDHIFYDGLVQPPTRLPLLKEDSFLFHGYSQLMPPHLT